MVNVLKINTNNTFGSNFIEVSIILGETVEDLLKYKFTVYKSVIQEGTYLPVGQADLSLKYKDEEMSLFDSNTSYFYKVSAKNIDTNEEKMFSIIGHAKGVEPDNYANSVIYQYNVYMDNVVRNKMYLLPKVRFGTRCSHCWDDIRMSTKDEDCNVCYGTGFPPGYFPPIKMSVCFLTSSQESTNEIVSPTDVGEVKAPIQVWVKNYPSVSVGDVFIADQGRRYLVISRQPTVKNMYTLRQMLVLQALPPSNIVYTVPLTGGDI